MAKKNNQELMQLDLYELLEVSINSNEAEIKKAYRKKALTCHPDKNPDNPDAAAEFDRLKKILEILLDPGARSAYDKVVRARKAASIRAKEQNALSQKFRAQLEEKERAAASQPNLSEEERFRRELKRLEEEGERLIQEELRRVNTQVEEELRKAAASCSKSCEVKKSGYKVKVKWECTEESSQYSQEDIQKLFYKWGEINAVAIKLKEKKGSALIEFKDKCGADLAVMCEKGMPGNPIHVEHIGDVPPPTVSIKKTRSDEKAKKKAKDFESIADMNKRRQDERRKLIEEMLKEEEFPK